MRILTTTLLVLAVSGIVMAQDGRFQIGQRVVQPTTRMTGVVTKIVPEARHVYVQFDGHATASLFFSGTPDLQPSNAPTPAQPAQGTKAVQPAFKPDLPAGAAGQIADNRNEAPNQGVVRNIPKFDNSPVPNNAPSNAATFKKLIAQRYTQTQAADSAISVQFLGYTEGAPIQHEAVYAADRNGRGHVVTAYPVHAKILVRKVYQNPKAPQEIQELEADYLCYKFADTGAWTASQEREVPGSRKSYRQ